VFLTKAAVVAAVLAIWLLIVVLIRLFHALAGKRAVSAASAKRWSILAPHSRQRHVRASSGNDPRQISTES